MDALARTGIVKSERQDTPRATFGTHFRVYDEAAPAVRPFDQWKGARPFDQRKGARPRLRLYRVDHLLCLFQMFLLLRQLLVDQSRGQ